jgi:hypothetical protein
MMRQKIQKEIQISIKKIRTELKRTTEEDKKNKLRKELKELKVQLVQERIPA